MLLDPEKYTLRYTLEVYDKAGKLAYEDTKEAVEFGGVTFDVRLLAKVYDFVFWADFVKEDGTVFYNVDNLKNIYYASTVVSAQSLANDAADAYYKKEEVDLTQSSKSLDVTLQRPFGKIRLIATDVLDGNNKQTEIPQTVTIDFGNALIPTAFNAFEGKVIEGSTADAGEVNFLANKETTMVNNQEKKDVYLLGINYIFESSAIPSYSMDVTVISDQGNTIGQRSLSSIPVQENKLTTVIGNFYTNEGSIDVVVEDSFEEPEIEMTEMEMLKNIASNGGEITLNDDCIFSEEAFIVDPGEGKSVVINLNGHTIESINPINQNDAIWVKSGTLTINGDGNVGGEKGYYAVWATGDSKVILNGGNYYGNGACIQAKDNAQVEINGGYYKVDQPFNGVYFVINLQDNHPNKIVVTGGQFENCDPSNTGTEPADVSDNFLAAGYSSVKISDNPDVYEVVGVPVIDDNAKTVKIYSASAMSAFAVMVNNGETFENYTVTLEADIDLNYQPWTPIGTSTNAFKGNFDGNGYMISNLKAGTDSQSDVGLFGYTTDGTIKDIHIHNAEIKGYLNVGVVAGTPYTTEYSDIKVTVGKSVYANLTNLTIEADEGSYVRAESENYRTYVGGVVGFMGEGGHSVSNVVSNIDVYGSTCDVGGITGIAHYNNKFINCSCTGNVTLENAQDSGDQLEIGGIAGVWHNENGTTVTFTNCSFTGTLTTHLNGVDCSEEIADTNKITGRAYSTEGTGRLIIN